MPMTFKTFDWMKPGEMLIIGRPQNEHETFEEWVKACVVHVVNIGRAEQEEEACQK
jgi:hypothetical protein